MKHSISELYRVEGAKHLLTKEAKEAIEHRCKCRKATYHTHSKDEVKVMGVDQIKVIYMFGSYLWFDTPEELYEYRLQYHAEQQALQARSKVRNAILAELDKMDIEQLTKLYNTIIEG